jgi:hypothetical protein
LNEIRIVLQGELIFFDGIPEMIIRKMGIGFGKVIIRSQFAIANLLATGRDCDHSKSQ